MIADLFENLSRYQKTIPQISDACSFFKGKDPLRLKEGRYSIRGDDVYAVVIRAHGKTRKAAVLEKHRKYIDVHILLEGVEMIGWSPGRANAPIRRPYESEADVEEQAGAPEVWLHLSPGSFALFLPGEPHAPLVSSGLVSKVVLKIRWRKRASTGRRADCI